MSTLCDVTPLQPRFARRLSFEEFLRLGIRMLGLILLPASPTFLCSGSCSDSCLFLLCLDVQVCSAFTCCAALSSSILNCAMMSMFSPFRSGLGVHQRTI